MNQPENLKTIRRFLKRQHVLTLCACSAGETWCANCFYAFDPDAMALYLMTEHSTRHGAMMAENPHVTGTIAHQTRTVALIKGIQYSGIVTLLAGDDERQARACYCRRFPIALALPAPIWQLSLNFLKMTDNALGFGKKLTWERGDN